MTTEFEKRWESIREKSSLVTKTGDGADLLAAILFADNADIDHLRLQACIEVLENRHALDDTMTLLWSRGSSGAIKALSHVYHLDEAALASAIDDARQGSLAFEAADTYETNLTVAAEWVSARLYAQRAGVRGDAIVAMAACVVAATDANGEVDSTLLARLVASDELAEALSLVHEKQSPIALLVLEVHDRLSPALQRMIGDSLRAAVGLTPIN